MLGLFAWNQTTRTLGSVDTEKKAEKAGGSGGKQKDARRVLVILISGSSRSNPLLHKG